MQRFGHALQKCKLTRARGDTGLFLTEAMIHRSTKSEKQIHCRRSLFALSRLVRLAQAARPLAGGSPLVVLGREQATLQGACLRGAVAGWTNWKFAARPQRAKSVAAAGASPLAHQATSDVRLEFNFEVQHR
jgi:hypothetical protein